MTRIPIIFILLAFILSSCQINPYKKLYDKHLRKKASQKKYHPLLRLRLDSFTPETPDKLWEQFFDERGAPIELWEELTAIRKLSGIEKKQASSNNLKQHFSHSRSSHSHACLDLSEIIHNDPKLAKQILEGIIRYLSYYSPELEKLTLNYACLQQVGINNLNLAKTNKLENIKDLDLNSNQLSYFPAAITQLVHLNSLDLNFNQISSLPTTIGNLSQLNHLSLSFNKLTSLPVEIENLSKLKALELGNNLLNELPLEVGHLPNLNFLGLEVNPLIELPPSIRNLRLTKKIRLFNNQLTVFPASLISTNIEFFPFEYVQPWDISKHHLIKIDTSTLLSYCYQKLPPSLLDICEKYMLDLYRLRTQEERQAIAKRLPQKFNPTTLYKSAYQAPLLQGSRIVYFHRLHFEEELAVAEGYEIPCYWDKKFCTNKDVKDLLNTLKEQPAYLVDEYHFSQLETQAKARQESLARYLPRTSVIEHPFT